MFKVHDRVRVKSDIGMTHYTHRGIGTVKELSSSGRILITWGLSNPDYIFSASELEPGEAVPHAFSEVPKSHPRVF